VLRNKQSIGKMHCVRHLFFFGTAGSFAELSLWSFSMSPSLPAIGHARLVEKLAECGLARRVSGIVLTRTDASEITRVLCRGAEHHTEYAVVRSEFSGTFEVSDQQ
jgi:hypothetical protein